MFRHDATRLTLHLLVLAATTVAGTGAAHATCIDERIAGLPYSCCTDDATGETTCTMRGPTPPRPPDWTCHVWDHDGDLEECCARVDRPSESTCGPPGWRQRCAGARDLACMMAAGPGAWDHARRDRFNVEVVLGALAGIGPRIADAAGPMTSRSAFGGVDAKLRVLYRWQASGSTTNRLLGIIPWLFIGNDFGIELRAGTFLSHDRGAARVGAYAALRPAALVSAGRLRVVAALDFLPEIGVYKVEGQPAELHWAMRLPVGAIVTRRVGIELELGAGPTLGYTGSVGVMLR